MTNNKQQTAVGQFAIALYQKFKLEGNGKELNDLVEQAKAMHKQEIINFGCLLTQAPQHIIEKAYNETYGGGEQ